MRFRSTSTFLLFFFLLSQYSLSAQNAFDALRYSSFEIGGTARNVAVGGALGALGADFGVINSNPAGMAMFRSSEMVFTPALVMDNTKTELTNDEAAEILKEAKTSFNLNNFGILVSSKPTTPNWKTFNFGIGYNRVAGFKRETFFEGRSLGSITDRFLEQLNSTGQFDEFETGVAFDAEALFDFDSDGIYESDYSFTPNVPLYKNQFIEESGSINELSFSFAGNYDEKVMIGITLGVPFVSFTQTKTYMEVDEGTGPDGDIPFFEDMTYTEELTTTGAGLNVKAGFIYRINQMVRFGLAVHSPTGYKLDDNFSTAMNYKFLNGSLIVQGDADSPDGFFEYKLRSPWRFIGSTGFLIKRRGFISAEIEWVDYSSASFRYSSFPDDERDVNNQIESTLQSTLNIRIGAELAVNLLRLRAGFGLLPSPVLDDDIIHNSISLGLGLRQESYFLDLAFRRTSSNSIYRPYQVDNAPEQVVDINGSSNNVYLTFGFKF